jgi:NADH:ubiquinone oxidoreductase subunit 5 (subunit L)/multisubunit Na+/H+ antiporter MnhA subunit
LCYSGATVSLFTVIFGVFCRFSPFFIESIQENSYNKHKQTRQKAWQHSLPSAILLCLWQAFCIILAQPAQGFPPAAAPPTAHNKRNAHEKEHRFWPARLFCAAHLLFVCTASGLPRRFNFFNCAQRGGGYFLPQAGPCLCSPYFAGGINDTCFYQ